MNILYIMQDILSSPAVLIAVIAMIGLILQKASGPDIIKGTLKSFLGFIIIGAGAGVLVGSLEPMARMFEVGFGATGVVPNNEAIIALALLDYGEVTAFIMFFGMIANLLLAKFTRLKYVFLTGHHTLYMACLIGVILVTVGLDNTMTIVVGSVALGLTMILFPAMAQSTMEKITNTKDVGLGHFSTIGYWASGVVGKFVGGKNVKSTEDINFPQSLAFFRDSSVAIGLTMTIIYLLLAIVAGPAYVHANLSGGTNFVLYSVTLGITFAAGVFIILQGVRLILAEIVPAFKGISEKFIPGAKPALDCPVVFPYAPNAVLIGFFASFLGGILGMVGLIAMGGIIILPGVVPHFFTGATAGVFGNATGGIRGAVLGAFVNGILLTFAPLLLMPLLGDLGFANTTFSDLDFIATGYILGMLGRVSALVVTAVVFAVAIGLVVFNFAVKKKD